MNYLFVINDAPYGDERPYNALRHAMNLVKRGRVATCGTCCGPRGLGVENLTEGVEIGSMDLLGDWTMEADQVLVY